MSTTPVTILRRPVAALALIGLMACVSRTAAAEEEGGIWVGPLNLSPTLSVGVFYDSNPDEVNENRKELMEAADLLENEQVAVLDIDNGARFETYAIVGGPGDMCLNGAAARLVQPGDRIIVISYADYDQAEMEHYEPRVVHVDSSNQIIDEDTAAAIAAATDPTPAPEDAIATVNGVPIARAAYETQVARAAAYFTQQPGFDATSEAGRQAIARFRAGYLEVMIDQALIAQAAAALGVAVSDEEIAAEMALVRGEDAAAYADWLAASGLTEESLRAQVADELLTRAVRDAVTADVPREQPQIHAHHILLLDTASAEEALDRLTEGDAFAQVAADLSQDAATRTSGGDLGYLPKGVMPPAFDEAAWALAPGARSGIVESEVGLHIILVEAEEATRPVAEEYWPAVQQHAFEDWLAAQRAAATVWRAE